MNRELTFEVEPRSLRRVLAVDELRVPAPGETIELDSSAEFECISVTTRQSVYEIILLSARTGEALVRGGTFFPTFRRATIAGSNFGGSALMVRSVCVGLRLEFVADGTRYVTSRIQTISHYPLRGCMHAELGSPDRLLDPVSREGRAGSPAPHACVRAAAAQQMDR